MDNLPKLSDKDKKILFGALVVSLWAVVMIMGIWISH